MMLHLSGIYEPYMYVYPQILFYLCILQLLHISQMLGSVSLVHITALKSVWSELEDLTVTVWMVMGYKRMEYPVKVKTITSL